MSVLGQPATCSSSSVNINGESFPCNNIDFYSLISLEEAEIPVLVGTTSGADLWGWVSPSGREITLWTVNNGLWFIDTSDPVNPIRLGYMPMYVGSSYVSATPLADVKVLDNVAYFSKLVLGIYHHGVLSFNLLRLESITTDSSTRVLEYDERYFAGGDVFNMAINYATASLYGFGTDQCGDSQIEIFIEGLEMADAICLNPDYTRSTRDGFCFTYLGGDFRFLGNDLCISFEEEFILISDVSIKEDYERLALFTYDNSVDINQGALTHDYKYLLVGDVQDERTFPSEVPNTRTLIFDISDLLNPVQLESYYHPGNEVDSNLFFWGAMHKNGWVGKAPEETGLNPDYAYLSNYAAGVKVLDAFDVTDIKEIGSFDVAPDLSGPFLEGAYSSFMHPSGVLAVSSTDRGLFLLNPRMAFDQTQVPTPKPTQSPTEVPTLVPTEGPISFPTSSPIQSLAPTKSPTRSPTAPTVEGWMCDGLLYNDGQICNCDCGLPDPDCQENSLQSAEGCHTGQQCVEGVCVGELFGWTCDPRYFDNNDGCDCSCGIPDPDCINEAPNAAAYGCDYVIDCVQGICLSNTTGRSREYEYDQLELILFLVAASILCVLNVWALCSKCKSKQKRAKASAVRNQTPAVDPGSNTVASSPQNHAAAAHASSQPTAQANEVQTAAIAEDIPVANEVPGGGKTRVQVTTMVFESI